MKKKGEANEEAEKPVFSRQFLSYSDIKGLFDGSIAAIRIPQFCSKDVCKIVSERILLNKERGSFNKASDIGRIGMAHFEIDGQAKQDEYHKNAAINTERLRRIFHPYFSPVDHMRLILEEIAPAGATIEIQEGRKCFVGICRIMDPSIELLAHNDKFSRDTPDSIQAKELLGQLSACIYLQVPEEGGGLRLWMTEPQSEEEYSRLKNGNYGISIEKLGEPAHIIEPTVGELVVFNVGKYHGVAPGKGKPRINVGLFIGYRGESKPLSYWS